MIHNQQLTEIKLPSDCIPFSVGIRGLQVQAKCCFTCLFLCLSCIFQEFWFWWISQMSHSSPTKCLLLLLRSKYHELLRNLSYVNILTEVRLFPWCPDSQCCKGKQTTWFNKPIPGLCEGTGAHSWPGSRHRETEACWERSPEYLFWEVELCFIRDRKADGLVHLRNTSKRRYCAEVSQLLSCSHIPRTRSGWPVHPSVMLAWRSWGK